MLRMQLFGAPHWVREASSSVLSWQRPTAVAVYLACQPGWVSREALATMLRPDAGTEAARGYLRRLLHRLGQSEVGAGIEAEPHRLRWSGGCDVRDFEEAVAGSRWDTALGLARGAFLDGVGSLGEPGLDDWVDEQRLRLAGRIRSALIAALDASQGEPGARAVAGDPKRRATLLQRLIDLDPLDEDAVQTALARASTGLEQAIALDAFATLSRRMAIEMALKPLPATQQLAAALRARAGRHESESSPRAAETAAAQSADDRNHSAADSGLTPIVGRATELAALHALVDRDHVALITLHGPGGIGKTRLARRWLDERAARGEKVAWVDLTDVHSGAALADTLAVALGVRLQDGAPWPQLRDWLAAHPRLRIVLDNFEQLIAEAARVGALFDAAGSASCIVTSREALGLSSETRLEVGGLPLGGSGSAVDLFEQHASRLGYARRAEDVDGIAALVRVVEGSPLAIELAASWVSAWSPAEIAQRLADDPGSIRVEDRDRRPEHRSLRHVFDASWRRLGVEQQQMLAALTVFRGGFTAAATRAVCGVDTNGLLRLAGQSLVRRYDVRRFALHALIAQFSAAMLAPERQRELELRHAQHFLGQVASEATLLQGTHDGAALSRVQTEADNVRAAWLRACAMRRVDLLAPAFDRYRIFLHQSRHHGEAAHLFGRSLEALPADHPLRPRIEAARAIALVNAGSFEQAEPLLAALASVPGDAGYASDLATAQAILASTRGDFESAEEATHRALAAAERAGDDRARAQALLNCASLGWAVGRTADSERYALQAIETSERLGANLFLARARRALSVVRSEQGRLAEARALIEASLAFFESIGERHDAAYDLRILSYTMAGLNDVPAQIAYARRSLETYEELGAQVPLAQGLFALGFALKRAQDPSARETLRCCLQRALALNMNALVARVLAELAHYVPAAQRQLAVMAVQFALESSQARNADRATFRARHDELAPDDQEVRSAQAALRGQSAATLASMVLAATGH